MVVDAAPFRGTLLVTVAYFVVYYGMMMLQVGAAAVTSMASARVSAPRVTVGERWTLQSFPYASSCTAE